MKNIEVGTDAFAKILNNVVQLSISGYYNPYQSFEWVDTLPDEQLWMSRDLLSAYGTEKMEQLTESQLMLLSKWESINFYSLNIHGIRELMMEVTKRIHSPGYELPSEFFHHFIGEENEHMWFFAQFCLKYGSKIYPDRMRLDAEALEPDVETFLVFSRILIFEELVDYFNIRMGRDNLLHPLIRKINSVHHQDESRHVTFGRQMVEHLHSQISAKYGQERSLDLEQYLKRYMLSIIQSLYNPAAYRDAGIADPYDFRLELMNDPARKPHHHRFIKRNLDFFVKSGIFTQEAPLL
jgi:hypothetical protein